MPLRRSSSTSTGITLVNTSSTANTPSSIVGNPYKKLTSTAQAVNIILGKISGATSGTKSDENSEIWNATLKDQINKLKPKDRKFCGPIRLDATLDEKTLAQIFTPLSIRYDKGLFQRLVKRIGPIADHVLSFGKAVDIAVGGGPLAAGLIWGGIRILLAVSVRIMCLHQKILDYVELLANYLPLFDRWMGLFSSKDFTQLAECLKKTCSEFLSFIVESIMFFRRPALLNTLSILFSPSLESRFSQCEARIKSQTEHLDREVATAGLEWTQKRDEEARERDEDAKRVVQKTGENIMKLIQETAPPTSVPATTFPFRFVQHCPRNNTFFGREDYMSILDSRLGITGTIDASYMRSIVIHGLGGCGKSSIAKEYMYRHYDSGKYEVILWMYADSIGKLGTQFIHIARQLKIKTNESDARDAVLHWINNLEKSFLIIFDNADTPSLLTDFWPCSTRGSIIITSRNPHAQDVHLAHHAIHLKAFSVDRGSEFLRSITSKARPLSSEDQEAVEWISRQFGGLPLALRQAGAFINHKVCSPSHYKRLYQEIYEKIENYKIPCATGHEKTIADIWQLSTSMLSEDARIILDALSLFDPDSIPAELLEVMDISHPHTEILKDPLRILDAREDLTSQSLVDHDYDSNTFSIHRLLQETTFRKLKKDVTRFRKTIHFSISLIHRLSPDIDLMMIRSPQHWKPMEKVLSHVHSIYDRSKNVITEAEAVILLHLMTKILNYGFETAQANLGDQAFQYIQELVREISQPDQEILALVYFTHGRLCCETSRQQQAIQEVVQSYNHIKNAAAGNPELFKTTLYVRILSNLGITHTAVERFDEAEKYHLRAIEHCKLLKMQKDCSMGNLLQNLANCYLWGGRMQEAKLTLDDARTYPNTAPEAVNYTLGNWMLKSKRYDEAAQLHKEVLKHYAKELGQNHPVTADSWHKMGSIFALQDYSNHDVQESERCFRKTLEIWEGLAQTPSPVVGLFLARARWSLGTLLQTMGTENQPESDKLKKEVSTFLEDRFPDGLPAGQSPEMAIESLIFYWKRTARQLQSPRDRMSDEEEDIDKRERGKRTTLAAKSLKHRQGLKT